MYRLSASSYFQLFVSLYETFRVCSLYTNYNWYYRHIHVTYLFLVLKQSPSTCLSFSFLEF